MANLGSITLNEIQIFEVDADPSMGGLAAPTGSMAILTDGSKMFLKYGEGDTAWNAVSPDSKHSYYTTSNVSTSANSYSNVSDLITDDLVPGIYKFDFTGKFTSNSGLNDIKVKIAANTASVTMLQGSGSIITKDDPTFVVLIYGFLQVTSIGTLVIQIKSNTENHSITLNEYSLLTLEKV